jgi:hypothetical protein
MNVTRDTLEDQLQNYETQLSGLKSFIRELKARTAEHGTEREHFETDLFEAEHNIQFYESEVARLKAEIAEHGGKPTPSPNGPGTPRTAKKGVGALVIGLLAGALVAVGIKKSRRGGKSAPDGD